MTVQQTVYAALAAVLANTWTTVLPAAPSWPALVFTVDSAPEPGWATGGAPHYDSHSVTVSLLTRNADDFGTMLPAVVTAMEGLADYMFEEDSGDADYEDDPEVFVRFIIFRLRTQRD